MTAAAFLLGDWRPLQGEPTAIHSPVDGSLLGEHREAAATELDALLASLAGIDVPAVLPQGARCEALRRLADSLEADAPRLAAAITLENGCPSGQAEKLQVHSAVGLLRAMAAIGEDFSFSEARSASRGGRVRIDLHPVGPALGIVPWNVPIFLACAKLASALLAGCPALLKPSPENLVSMRLFGEHLAALDVPAGVLNLLIGGRELGSRLVAHPVFSKVSFTGSSVAGRSVARVCADRLARCTLELGGKSAALLLDDVDLPSIAGELFLAMLQNNGQVCGAQSRLLLPASRYDELRDALVALFDGLVVGDPRDAATQVGPVISVAAAQRIRATCARGEAGGARRCDRGVEEVAGMHALVTPRLYDVTDIGNELWTDELFGPVVALCPYDSEAEAIALANDSTYGLSGSVWSSDPERALAVAARLRTGTVAINSKKILDFAAPFGGWRQSGVGREFGPEGIREYLEATTILIP